jgi:hypothetical protein
VARFHAVVRVAGTPGKKLAPTAKFFVFFPDLLFDTEVRTEIKLAVIKFFIISITPFFAKDSHCGF